MGKDKPEKDKADNEKPAAAADTADSTAVTEEGAAPPKRKGKLLILILVPIIILLIVGAVLFFGGFLGKGKKKASTPEGAQGAPTEQSAEGEKGAAAPPPGPPAPAYQKLDEFLVDLSNSTTPSFIKLEIVLKLANKEVELVINQRMPEIRDSFITYLRELKTNDLYGSSGLFTLKQELMLRLNKIIAPAIVEEIYIQNILTR